MAKAKSFADKMAKSAQDFTTHCPICGESITVVKRITSEKSEKTGAWRFNQKFIGLCKCGDETQRAAKQAENAAEKAEKPEEQIEKPAAEKAEEPKAEKADKPETESAEPQAEKPEAAEEKKEESKEEKAEEASA